MERKNNVLRGRLLRFFYDARPDEVELVSLMGVFYEYFKVDSIEREVEYLTDKGYTKKREVPHPYKQGVFISLYSITSSGVDLIEGLKKDMAVAVVAEE